LHHQLKEPSLFPASRVAPVVEPSPQDDGNRIISISSTRSKRLNCKSSLIPGRTRIIRTSSRTTGITISQSSCSRSTIYLNQNHFPISLIIPDIRITSISNSIPAVVPKIAFPASLWAALSSRIPNSISIIIWRSSSISSWARSFLVWVARLWKTYHFIFSFYKWRSLNLRLLWVSFMATSGRGGCRPAGFLSYSFPSLLLASFSPLLHSFLHPVVFTYVRLSLAGGSIEL